MTNTDELREMMAKISEYWVTASGEPELKEFAQYLIDMRAKDSQRIALEARIDELVDSYNANFIHWGDNLDKAKVDVSRRLTELKSQLQELDK